MGFGDRGGCLVFLAGLASCSSTGHVASGPGDPTSAVRTAIDAVFAKANAGGPGCGVAVTRGGAIVYETAFGLADIEQGRRIDADTVFDAASIAKQFTATAIHLLASEGKVSLDDPVQKYVPEIVERETPMTIRQLLHHTSGLRNLNDLVSIVASAEDYPVTDAAAFALLSRQRTNNFTPGSDFLYSNSGYYWLGVIAKRVSGKPLDALIGERVLKPTGLVHSWLRADRTALVPRRARAYARGEDGAWHETISASEVVGPANLYTTTRDLARWLIAADRIAIGGERLTAVLGRPGHTTDGREVPYGSGLVVTQYRGEPMLGHAGVNGGYRSYVMRFPRKDLGLVCLCNADTFAPRRLLERATDVLLEKDLPPARADLPALAGEAGSPPIGFYLDASAGVARELVARDGKLVANVGDAVVPLTGHAPVYRAQTRHTNLELRFSRDGDGWQLEESRDGWRRHSLRFVGVAANGAKAAPHKPDGRYFSDEIGVELAIESHGAEAIELRLPDGLKLPLRRLYGDLYIQDDMTLAWLEPRPGGPLPDLVVTVDRSWRMAFAPVTSSTRRDP